MKEKICPHCGAPLPEEASFCPRCAGSINRRTALRPPTYIPIPFLRFLVLAGIGAAVLAALFFYFSPKKVEGTGDVIYTDDDGTYQILSNVSTDRYYPMSLISQDAGDAKSYRFPLRLYINHKDTGVDASGIFLQKVESCELLIEQPPDSAGPVTATEPLTALEYPGTALVSYINFSRRSSSPVWLIWSLHMKNGDTISVKSELSVTPIHTYEYSQENADLSTSQSLQELIDRLVKETDRKDIVNITLPAVTYDEPLVLYGRAFNLTGTRSGEKQTAFSSGIRIRAAEDGQDWICYFTDLDFPGTGKRVAISAANRVWTRECRFTDWDTALLAHGDAWINTTDCLFEGNQIGLHYNISGGGSSDTRFTGNTFTGNATAVLLEQVATDIRMDFGDCLFEGNGTDIDNRCRQPVDISQAVFQ